MAYSAYDEESDDWLPVVIDNGSGTIAYGEAGEEEPKSFMSTVVGRHHSGNGQSLGNGQSKRTYIGDEMQRRRSVLSLNYPIEHGIVTDWDDMEEIWRYLFRLELRVDPRDHQVLITEPPRNPKYNREKMAQIMFETFQIPELYVAVPALLSLYAAGRTSGFVVESGEGNTHMMAIYDGFCIKAATHRTSLAGREMTNHLTRLLHKRGYSFATSAEREIVREMKERHCYVAQDYELELRRPILSKRYTLPDGQEVTLETEVFECMEAMFQPALLNQASGTDTNYSSGIADMVHCGLQRCDPDTRLELYRNVVLTGGNTMHRGFAERLRSELARTAPGGCTVNVVAPPERRSSVWIGGSILGSLQNYRAMWTTKSAYEEYGPTVIHHNSYNI